MLIGKFSRTEVLYIFAATLFGPFSDLWNDLGCAFAMHINWDHSTEMLFWAAHLGIFWVRHHRLGYSFALHQCLHLACTKIGTSSLAPWRKDLTTSRHMQNMSERSWKQSQQRLVMCNTMAYILLALCHLDLIRDVRILYSRIFIV